MSPEHHPACVWADPQPRTCSASEAQPSTSSLAPALPGRNRRRDKLPFVEKDLVGTWQGDCGLLSSTGLPGNGSFTRRYNFDRTVGSVRYELFSDDSCATPTISFFAVFGLELGPAVPDLPSTRVLFAPFIKLTVRPDSEEGVAELAVCNATAIGQDYDVTLSGCPALGFRPTTECVGDYDLVKLVPGRTLTAGLRTPNMCVVEGQPTRTQDDVLATLVRDA